MGKQAKSLGAELARLFQSHADQSALEGVALRAAMIPPAMIPPTLVLQKPFRATMSKDDIACIKREWVIGVLAILRLFLKKIGPFKVG